MPRSKYSLINRKTRGLALVAFVLLAGCDDPAPEPAAQAPGPAQAQGFEAGKRRWIEAKDDVSPAAWLASREAGRDLDRGEPAVATLRDLLGEADIRFTEGPRMIANRAVQVEEMLAERGVKETPREIIAGLVSLAALGERAGFGETCQHYVNARAAGPDREAALGALRGKPLPAAVGDVEEP